MTKKQEKGKLVIKSKSATPLALFESADQSQTSGNKYVFQGVFTACSTPDHTVVNRNGRVYTAQECLRHLAYLRENIRRDGFILGELDHPVDRFDTQLKEASHKITDLWYDQNTACIMGKIEILDTPNGKIARQLVDSGYPVFVSSRAAGEVDQKSKEVHIEQIFTYDIVCTPGFAEARLERVNESMRPKVKKYLNESAAVHTSDTKTTKKYGIIMEGVTVSEYKGEIPMDETKKELMEKEIDMKELCEHIVPLKEEDNNFQLPMADLNPNTAVKEGDDDAENTDEEKKTDDAAEKKDDSEKKNQLTDEEKAANRAKILSVQSIEKGEELTDAEKEENREKILDVEGIEADAEEKTDNEEEEVFDEENKEENAEDEKTDECNTTGEAEDDNKAATKECGDDQKEDDSVDPRDMKSKDGATNTADAKKVLNDCDKQEDIKKKTEADMDKFKALLDKAKKVSDVKESIVKAYPFSISLSDANFARFAALTPAQKNKVNKFITEHAIFDIQAINDNWATPLLEERRLLKNWLRLATNEDRRLFAEATKEQQDAIEESAKYVLIRNEEECDRFWARTGLRQANADRILRQSINENYNVAGKIAEEKELDASDELANALGYRMNYMKMVEEML